LKTLCRELVERKACFDLRNMKLRQHKRTIT